jgi:CubicO group peptidase (beta-lactamase class C family)
MARLGLAVCCLSLLAPAQQARPAPAELRAYLEGCSRFGFAGSVLVARAGKVLLADGFGLADRDKGIRNTKDTLFEIASATKPFTAVAILQLEVEEKLSCEDPIGRHLPGVPAGFEGITIRHLLTHTSGMPRSAGAGQGDDLAAAVARYLSRPRARPPGAAYEYWNGGYALLAGIVERAAGGTYMDWCRKRIFEPAGMTSSGFTGDSFDPARVAIGYETGAAPRRADEHPYNGSYGWHYRGMGGLVTTVEDLHRFDRALGSDALLPAAARRKLFTPFLGGYACGFQVVDRPERKIGHGGSVRGFHCQFSRFPDRDACIVVLCNGLVIPPFVIEETLHAIAIGGTLRYPKPPPTVEWPADELEALAGRYEAAPGERIVVRVLDRSLVLGAEGPGIMRELGPAAVGTAPEPADPAFVEIAKRVVKGLAAGDVAPLREVVAPGIPATWPQLVLTKLWPERTAGLGTLLETRVAGAVRGRTSTTILLACDFERGSVNIKLAFPGDRLQILDLHGPRYLVEAFAAPAPDGRLVRFHWQGAQAAPIAVVRDSSRQPVALRVDGSGAPVTYRRLPSR